MIQIRQRINKTIYGYNPQQFLPIWIDGKLSNRGEFITYKARRVVERFSDTFDAMRDECMKH